MSVAYRPRSEATKLTITQGQTLAEVLAAGGLTGQLDLVARYNWGTKKPAEINRALLELIGCETLNDDPLLTKLDPARGTGGAICKPEPWAPAALAVSMVHTVKVRKCLPATAAVITELPNLFNPASATCDIKYTLEGDPTRATQKDVEIHATGYYAVVPDRANKNIVEKPSGTQTIDALADTYILRKREAGAPGAATLTWDGKSEAAVGVLKTPAKINSSCAPYFVSVRFYKEDADRAAFLRLDPFYPQWKLTGKAKWDLDEDSLLVKWKLEGPTTSTDKLKRGQLRVYDKDGLLLTAPLSADQIKGGQYDLLHDAVKLDPALIEPKRLPYRIQLQAHSDEEEDNGLALAVMPTQVPGYHYEQVQFIGFNVRNDVANPTTYLGRTSPDQDIDRRCEAMIQAIKVAYPDADTNPRILKVFMAPEFYFRGKEGAYPVEKISDIVPKLRAETDKHEYLDWLFVFGTALGYQKHQESAGVGVRHGEARHRFPIIRVNSPTQITVKAWVPPQAGWRFESSGQSKVLAAPPGPLEDPPDPDDGGRNCRLTLNSTSGLVPGRDGFAIEEVMTILDTEPTGAPSTTKIKVASDVCGRIAVDPRTGDVVAIAGLYWSIETDGKTAKVMNVQDAGGHYVLTLDTDAAYEAGKPLVLVEPLATELFNVALLQKGWHSPHQSDGSLRQMVTYKEDLSHIDFIRDKNLNFYDRTGKNRKIRMHYTDDVPLLPTDGGKDIGGASPNVTRAIGSAVGSEINESGLGGGCVVMVDRVTFGVEVCRDHCVDRLFNFYTGTNVRPKDPQVQVQLIPSWGMSIGLSGPGKEVTALPNGLVFNVDGSRMESVARVADGKYSCDTHITASSAGPADCTRDWTIDDPPNTWYPCHDCPGDPKYYKNAACATHGIAQCQKPYQKLGTSIPAGGAKDVAKTDNAVYFKSKGNVRVFPPKPLPPPDVAVDPPELTCISGASIKPGFKGNITLDGARLQEVKAIRIDAPGVEVVSFTVVSDAQVTARISVRATAAPGTYKVTASTFSGQSNALDFAVEMPPVPVINTVTPDEGEVANWFDLALAGANLKSVYEIRFSSAGVHRQDILGIADDRFEVQISVDDVAAAGPCTITLKNAAGSASIDFLVKSRPAPTLVTADPPEVEVGYIHDLALEGTDLALVQNVDFSDPNVTLKTPGPVTDDRIEMEIDVDPAATLGACTVTVTTLSGTATIDILIKPRPLPTVTSVVPATFLQGTARGGIIVTGTGLDESPVVSLGAGVTVDSTAVDSDTQLTIGVSVDDTAATGARDLVVATTYGDTAPFAVTVSKPPAPTISGINRASESPGKRFTVRITGTNLITLRDLVIGGADVHRLNVSNLKNNSVDVELGIAPSAAPGARTITLTTLGGTATVDFTVV